MPTREIRLADHTTLIDDEGGGSEPVILLHALGLDRAMWRGVVEALGGVRRTIAYDLRSNGRGASAPAGDLTHYASDLSDLLDSLGLSAAHIVGVSMGGAVAMTFAGVFPERTLSLTLLCAPAKGLAAFAERGSAALEAGMTAQLEPTLQRWFSEPDSVGKDALAYAAERLLANTAQGWAANWTALAGFAPTVVSSDIPVTLVAGSDDLSTPPDHMRGLFEYCPGAAFHVIEGGHHMLVLERPIEVARLVEKATGQGRAAR